jgi:hypothetical protein
MGKYNHGLNGLGWTKKDYFTIAALDSNATYLYLRLCPAANRTLNGVLRNLRINLQMGFIAALQPGK